MIADHLDEIDDGLAKMNELLCHLREEVRLLHIDHSNRIETLETTFRHIHQRGETRDSCGVCGLDLRDPIHTRWREEVAQ